MDQLKRFMYGRYGFDRFSSAIILFTLFMALTASLTHSSLLLWLSYIPLIYAFFRILSKNTQKRAKENYIYCEIISKVKAEAKNAKLLLVGTKTHKYYRCKGCRQMLRIPRGKGKIRISCPKCKREFISRT